MVRHRRCGALRHLFAIALVAASVVIAQAPARAADVIGQLLKLRGEVALTRAGTDQPATAGLALALHDTVKTGANARAQIEFADGSTVTLGENSALAIDRYALNSAAGSRNVLLSVLNGAVNAVVTKSGQGYFDYEIRTTDGYSSVRGTNWIVAVQGATTRMVVISGLVEVGSKTGNRVVCEAGETVTISAANGLGTPSDAPPDVIRQFQDATVLP
jgi:hypothetical protein